MKRNYKTWKDEASPRPNGRVDRRESTNKWYHSTCWKNHLHYMGARRAAFGGS